MAFLHARNLALYGASYKAGLAALAACSSDDDRQQLFSGSPLEPWHAAVAGGLGGYLVWGSYSGVNYQAQRRMAPRESLRPTDNTHLFAPRLGRSRCTCSLGFSWRPLASAQRKACSRSAALPLSR